METVNLYTKDIGKCSVCKSELKAGDYLAAGPQRKPFCKRCEIFIYPSWVELAYISEKIRSEQK